MGFFAGSLILCGASEFPHTLGTGSEHEARKSMVWVPCRAGCMMASRAVRSERMWRITCTPQCSILLPETSWPDTFGIDNPRTKRVILSTPSDGP
jgi:hypothetical protein